MTAKGWIKRTGVIVVSTVALLCVIVYVVDPLMQFRVRDGAYLLPGAQVAPGLIRNYDYDTLMIGSSVIQNFDMELFRDEIGGRPLHIGIGGMSAQESVTLIRLAQETGKAKTYYLCIDLPLFANDERTDVIPDYLCRTDPLSGLRYFTDYAVWFRYLPVDIGLVAVSAFGISMPDKVTWSTQIDKLENWELDYELGKDIVMGNYMRAAYSVSDVDLDGLLERMKASIDAYLAVCTETDAEVIFFFPPYSVLFWINARDSGYFDVYMEAKRYFVERASQAGTVIYDFQTDERICDLDLYRDTTHYGAAVNDRMIHCFADGTGVITAEDSRASERRLREMMDAFQF